MVWHYEVKLLQTKCGQHEGEKLIYKYIEETNKALKVML